MWPQMSVGHIVVGLRQRKYNQIMTKRSGHRGTEPASSHRAQFLPPIDVPNGDAHLLAIARAIGLDAPEYDSRSTGNRPSANIEICDCIHPLAEPTGSPRSALLVTCPSQATEYIPELR